MKTQSKQMNAGEALTAKRFVDAEGKHTVDIPCIGVTANDVASGDGIDWQPDDKPWVVEAGDTITLGTHYFVKSDANGKAVGTATFDIKVCGKPIDSGVDGGFIRVVPL